MTSGFTKNFHFKQFIIHCEKNEKNLYQSDNSHDTEHTLKLLLYLRPFDGANN